MPLAVYIAVFAVVVLGLLLAWRGLGVHASIGPVVLDVAAASTALREALTLLGASEPAAVGSAQRARRLAAGVSLQVAQAADAAQDDAGRAVSALLAAAADDCVWAARMAESPAYAGNPGLRAGVAALLEHARRCVDEAMPAAV